VEASAETDPLKQEPRKTFVCSHGCFGGGRWRLPNHCRLSVLHKTAAGTWGSGRFVLRREAKWGRTSAEASQTWPGSPGSLGVPAGVRPEGASCDFAKMVFTNSGDNTCTTVPTQEWTCSLDPNLVLLAGKVTHKHHSDRLGFMPAALHSRPLV
jgi:hypothetical protein